MSGETKQLLKGAVAALPVCANELLYRRADKPQEGDLLAICRFLFMLTAMESDFRESIQNAAGEANSRAPKSIPIHLSSRTITTKVSVGIQGVWPQRSFGPNSALSIGRLVLQRAVGQANDNQSFHEQQDFETIADYHKQGELSQSDREREVAFESLGNGTSPWSFWVKWRRDYLDGKSPDPALVKHVVEFRQADWDTGPERIGRLLESVLRQITLERLDRIEEALSDTALDRHGIGGNNPPPGPLDAQKPIEIIKHESRRDNPDRRRLNSAIERLSAIVVTWAKWLAGKAETAIDSYSAQIGKSAAQLTWPYIIAEMTGLLDIARLWLATLF